MLTFTVFRAGKGRPFASGDCSIGGGSGGADPDNLSVGDSARVKDGELLALKVQDVDLLGGWLYIRRNCYRGVVNDTPKTPDSERRLPLPGPIVSLIAAHCMGKEPDAWLFPSTAGKPFDDRNLIRREVEPVCNRLGLPGFTWDSLRHTFSTYAGNSGMAMPVLQSLLGHTTPEVTMRYTHPLEQAQREAIDRLA